MAGERLKKAKKTEIVLLVIFGCIAALGLILAVLGIVAFNLPTVTKNNPLYQAQQSLAKALHMGKLIDFRILGAIILVVGVVLILVTLQHYAAKHDEIKAKIQRREERRRNLMKEMEAQQARQEKAKEENIA